MQIENAVPGLQLGLVRASGLKVEDSPAPLRKSLEELVAQRAAGEDFPGPDLKESVRALLRAGGYRPAGRGKPASEYLVQMAKKGEFPFINGPVDINNLISLRSGLPISLLDADVVGEALRLRLGREDESYIFNRAGQEISLRGLVVACRGADDRPLGNPVKDSMAGKISASTTKVVALIYAPLSLPRQQLYATLIEFGQALAEHCGAREHELEIHSSSEPGGTPGPSC